MATQSRIVRQAPLSRLLGAGRGRDLPERGRLPAPLSGGQNVGRVGRRHCRRGHGGRRRSGVVVVLSQRQQVVEVDRAVVVQVALAPVLAGPVVILGEGQQV